MLRLKGKDYSPFRWVNVRLSLLSDFRVGNSHGFLGGTFIFSLQ